jgi:hypothetical protein
LLNPPKQESEEPEATPAKPTKKPKGKRGEKVTSPIGTPSVSNIQTEPDRSLKMTLQLGQSPPGTEAAGTRSSKKSRGKKDVLPSLSPLEIPELPDVTSIMEGKSGLKLKLILSPTKDKSATAISSPEAEDDTKRKKKSESKKKKGKEKDGSGIEKIKIKDILAAQQMARDAKALEQQNLVQQSALAMHLTLQSPKSAAAPANQTSPMAQPESVVSSTPAPDEGKSKKKKSKKKVKEQTIPEIADEILSGWFNVCFNSFNPGPEQTTSSTHVF